MPRLAKALSFALILAATGCTTTGGGSGGVVVPAGRTTDVNFLSVLNPRTCQNQRLPKTTVIQPANGSVRVVPGTQPANFAQQKFAKCADTQVRGLRVLYTPKPGFRGRDTFGLRLSFEERPGSRRTSTQTYAVTVQ